MALLQGEFTILRHLAQYSNKLLQSKKNEKNELKVRSMNEGEFTKNQQSYPFNQN
jgi:hypothetical protein